MPPDACDCHTHIFDPARFPFAGTRRYTPEPASIEEMARLHRALRTTRVVIVQPSVYGTDNACTVDAARRIGKPRAVCASSTTTTSEASLDEWHRAGIRGIRLNLETGGISDPAIARQRFSRQSGDSGHAGGTSRFSRVPAVIARLDDLIRAAPMPIVFDHFGSARPARGPANPASSRS